MTVARQQAPRSPWDFPKGRYYDDDFTGGIVATGGGSRRRGMTGYLPTTTARSSGISTA